MTELVMDKTKNIEVSRHVSLIFADKNGKANEILADNSSDVPSEFELLKVGMWRTPYHGDIMIMPDDLTDYMNNFEAGLAVAGNGKIKKLPINYAHEAHKKAAGWFVPEVRGDTLWATNVEWTPAGRQSLIDGEWKCISAEFCPAGRGGWCDPLDSERYVDNVLEGAALTNIPLFSNLDPVKASATFGKDKTSSSVFLITASEVKETKMTLAEVIAKDPSTLNEDEKNFLALDENKSQLTDEQKTAFGFEVAPVENKKEEEQIVPEVKDEELTKITASIKSGESVVIKASALKAMESSLRELKLKDIASVVSAHAARGAIRTDQIKTWTDKIEADASMAEILENLPSNPVLADTQGTDKDAGDATALEADLNAQIMADQKAEFQKDGTKRSYSEVRASIIKNNDKFKSLQNVEGQE